MVISTRPGLDVLSWYSWKSPIFLQVDYSFNCTVLVELSWSCSSPFVPFWKVLESFWRECFVITRDVLISILPTFWYCCTLNKKVSRECLTFSPMVVLLLLLLQYFLLLCRGAEVEIEVIEKSRVIITISILVIYSPCHVVTFQSAARSIPLRSRLRWDLFRNKLV